MSLPILLLWLLSISLKINASPQRQGIHLNCGGNEVEESEGLEYVVDNKFISVGNKSAIKQPDILPILKTVRYFPNTKAKKYCYRFPVSKGEKVLVKTIYYYGGFDGGSEPPVFDQIIDGTKWSTVDTREDFKEGLTSYYEIITRTQKKMLSLCLARNQQTRSSPFISAVEVHYLESSLYNSTDFAKYALLTVARNTFGSSDNQIVGYPDDKYNRLWHPYMDSDYSANTSQSNVTTTNFWNIPPAKVFSDAMTSGKGENITFQWPPFSLPSSLYHIALYFQDNRVPGPDSWRVFDININGQKYFKNLKVTTGGVTVYGTEWPLNGDTNISLVPGNGMTVGPIINAGEVYQILALGRTTMTRDVVAMLDLAKNFENEPEDWAGDPCMPKENAWTGVTCSNSRSVRVVSVNLTGYGVTGKLPQSLYTLTALKHLWLGNNKLSGELQDTSNLKSLETLHLENNQFEGKIPDSLGKLPNLRELNLHKNKFKGGIPQSLKENKNITLHVGSLLGRSSFHEKRMLPIIKSNKEIHTYKSEFMVKQETEIKLLLQDEIKRYVPKQ